jgi:hypothetical protein
VARARLTGAYTAIVALAALAGFAASPESSRAAQTVIPGAGPLSAIYIDEDLGCQVQSSGDISPSFFGGTEPGACGTFLSLTQAPGEEVGFHHVFGPSPPAGVAPEAAYNTVSQEISGTGSQENPYVVRTVVEALEPREELTVRAATIVETDTYVSGADSYETTIEVKGGAFILKGTLYHAGDCFLSSLDTGFGASGVPTPGAVACAIQPADNPASRFMSFAPGTEGSSFIESYYATVWSYLNAEATPFPDTVDTAINQDNGMGLSWPIELSRENPTATFRLTTTVTPSSAPSSSSSSGCSPDGQIPVHVSAVNGATAVDYTLDGGPAISVPTDAAGNATISAGAGTHTVEFWGQDQTGAQEPTHHLVAVGGPPTLTITSDQGKVGYVLGEPGSVTVAAGGGGLTGNPSQSGVPISTSQLGTFTLSRTTVNGCGTTSASFTYTVLPAPVLGKSVNVEPVSGKVLVALPGGASASRAAASISLNKGLRFVPLAQARQIPVGSTLQTTAGVARLTTATATRGQLQFGDFTAGIFKLLQNRRQRGLTQLDLIDSHKPNVLCASTGKARVAAKHLSSKTLGRLTGTAHGKFTTRGKYSAATVRGTIWGVTDQCNGTLTKVTRGVVTVRDFVRRKTVTVRAGQQYLARAPH